MNVAGSAVGIASLGIQVCQGLLSYYDSWKGYHSDVSSAYDSIDDLSRTLILLKGSLDADDLDEEKKERVKRCLHSCQESLVKLSQKCQKLRKYGQPEGSRQKAWAELQRSWYPFRASTLSKLREIVADVRERLKLAVQVLQLDVSTTSQRILKSVAVDTSNTVSRTVAIATSVAHVSAQNQQILDLQQSDQCRKIVAWLSPPDPWSNHDSARRRHEPDTGHWLLKCEQYCKWKAGLVRHLWLYGKAGCGKTVLCYTVIEDIRRHCDSHVNVGFAVFYFTFSDKQKQSYQSLLLSLVVQLGWREPAQSTLRQMFESPKKSVPSPETLEKILLLSIMQYDEVSLLLDALDECPEYDDARQDVLDLLQRLAQSASNLRIFTTSRQLLDIQSSMADLAASSMSVITYAVDADIERYVEREQSRDRRLNGLSDATKALISETLTQKADGMFRWAFCQLHELKKLKSTKPSRLEEALRSLPATLDETYERMLAQIAEVDRSDALTALRWMAFECRPLTMGEIAEACIIDPSGDGVVEMHNRGGIEDVFKILAGLVVVEGVTSDDKRMVEESSLQTTDVQEENDWVIGLFYSVSKETRIRLAHFSVKEYLVSDRILRGEAREYHLTDSQEHRFIAQSCLTYLLNYSNSSAKTSSERDLIMFPLLDYAARSWFYHSSLQQPNEVCHETELLCLDESRINWLRVHQPDQSWRGLFKSIENIGAALYYASFIGLEAVVDQLLTAGADVNAQGGVYGNALQAASSEGHKKAVQMLIGAGADVNAQGGEYGNALQAASWGGEEKVVQMLMDAGADVNAPEGDYGNAVQAASEEGHEKVVQVLIGAGADVNAQGGRYGNALQAASWRGHEKVVEMLIDAGADVNARGGRYGNALQAASWGGAEKVVQMLIDAGADVNAPEGDYGNALQAASWSGHETVVEMLMDAGADVNAQARGYGNALQAASERGHEKVVEMLIERGADVTAQGGYYGNSLQAASWRGHENVVEMLMDAGADVNAQGGYYSNALQAASWRGHEKVAQILIERGADVNAQGGYYDNALQAASWRGHEKVVEILIERGANVNAQGGHYGNALQAASERGHEKVVEMLIERGADVNAQGGYYGNSLQAASWRGHENVVEMLMDAPELVKFGRTQFKLKA